MRIKHFLYNTFIIESGEAKIAIDPGFDTWIFKFKDLLPKSEWPGITHILITHGDIDHYWSPDRIAEFSNAHLICGKDLVRQTENGIYILDPRNREIGYSTPMDKVSPLDVGDSVQLDGMTFEAYEAVHGTLTLKFFFGLINITETPGPGERIGIGSTVFKVTLNGQTFVNLGDTILVLDAWDGLKNLQPDVLMVPIGGGMTMDIADALEIVEWMSPKMVIPCHYNCDFLFKKNGLPADSAMFKREVEKMGFLCTIMHYGDEIEV